MPDVPITGSPRLVGQFPFFEPSTSGYIWVRASGLRRATDLVVRQDYRAAPATALGAVAGGFYDGLVTLVGCRREPCRVAETAENIAHLLRRTEFVARPERVAALQGLNRDQAVDNVLAFPPTPPLPAYYDSHDNTRMGWKQYEEASAWWIQQMVGPLPPTMFDPAYRPFKEKMTLFWHGHFTSCWSEIHLGYHMVRQGQMYRINALGNLRNLAQQMAIEPAMLVYLSNALSVKSAPNQNFGRELLELFTLGVGNYAEDDVAECARAWTGHNYRYATEQYYFDSTQHDYDLKTIFGKTQPWNGPEIIDEIMLYNPAKQRIAARFVVKKLWEFLAYVGPDPVLVVEPLADVLIASGMSLLPLMRALLLRDEFYSVTAKQGLVRAPLEWITAACYHSRIPPSLLDLAYRSELTGQTIFQPPNVSGWRPNSYWLNSSALSGRASLARTVADYLVTQPHFSPPGTAAPAVDYAAAFFGISNNAWTTPTRTAMIDHFTGPWSLAMMAMLSPEFVLA